MFRPALAFCSIMLVAAPVGAASYSAKLSQPTTNRFIARDISWNCGPDACQGSTQNGRPIVLCQSLAKQAGRIDSFVSDGRALSMADLDRCNASAKARADAKLAAKQ